MHFHYQIYKDYLLYSCYGINLNHQLIYKSSFQDTARETTGKQIDATEDSYCNADIFSVRDIKVSFCFRSLICLSLSCTLENATYLLL
jgi:hypothetical protein